ncbi:beta-1,3-glucan-binding protein 1-like, partial [Anoplophora glabripennis]|uniref:beta-1,3-glucan-binding protein 1-like n=1 Tax=Anoplophora glabripennis TaxID=217634 RepID=UPI000873BF31
MKPIAYFFFAVIQSDLLLALYVPQEYVVPEPKFEVYSSGGFSVSIPHEDGIQLFSFHGNVNRPMVGLTAGQFSRDVVSRNNDRWVYENKNAKLELGDVIYFWVLIIKDNLGYRYDNGQFVFKGNLFFL